MIKIEHPVFPSPEQWMLDNVPYFKDLVEHIEGQNKVDAKAV